MMPKAKKKYEMTDKTKVVAGVTLHRIRALVDIAAFGIEAGDVGGWIESEINLSQDGDAWVADNARISGGARVFGGARIYDDARIYDGAQIFGGAQIYGNARVDGDAWVFGGAQIYGNARIDDGARVFGGAQIYGNARVDGDAWVAGNARIYAGARVCGGARIHGEARVYGEAQIYGGAQIYGEAQIYGGAQIYGNARIYAPIICATRTDGYTFVVAHDQNYIVRIIAGCRYLTLDEARHHWTKTRGGTRLGAESLALIDHLERMAKLQGWPEPKR